MIVARITDQNKNRNPMASGSSRLKGYENWFPMSSVGISFPSARENPQSASSKPQNSIKCSRPIDVATSDLMYLSVFDKLMDREGTTKKPAPLAADIHFLEVASASLEAGKETKPVVFLKVALEEVAIDAWSLKAAGDDRPFESFELKFERIAIQYIQYDSKGNMLPSSARGFSQTDLKSWIPESLK